MKNKNTVCQELYDISQELFNWQSSQINVNEESLTDWLLYQYSLATKSFVYTKFSHYEENKKTGADWDWQYWVITKSGSIGFRIQAKKLGLQGSNLRGLSYKKNTWDQMDRLIKSARVSKLIPAYVFYAKSNDHDACLKSKPNIGAFICGALAVKNQVFHSPPISAKASTKNLINLSIPLHCIACCEIAASEGFLHRYFPNESLKNDGKFAGLHNRIPKYVAEYLEIIDSIPSQTIEWFNSNEDSVSDVLHPALTEWRDRYARYLRRTGIISVLDLRGSDFIGKIPTKTKSQISLSDISLSGIEVEGSVWL